MVSKMLKVESGRIYKDGNILVMILSQFFTKK